MNPDDFDFLLGLVRTRTGLVLRGDKGYFFQSRLAPLARREGLASVEALVTLLKSSGEDRLIQQAVEAMSIADTAFFRDKAVFDHIRDEILPTLAAARGDETLCVWCAGCSTGQEAYSLAMLADQVRQTLPRLKLEIIGTDLSRRVLEKAHSGLYTQFEVQRGLPIRMLLEHFDKVDDTWRVNERLRHAVRWRQLNLLDDRRSVRPFDLILCRNVTSAFEPETRRRVLEQMAPALAPDGYLVLGSGETLDAPSFELDSGALRTFRRARAVGRVAA